MTTLTIPTGVQRMTAAWLTDALRSTETIAPATSVSSFDHEIIGAGAGFIGQLARVSLTHDRPDPAAPASLIAKYPTLDPAGREIGMMFRFYERESRFFAEIAQDVPVRVPRCYFNGMQLDTGEFILLLEDLDPARVGDQVESCSIEEAKLAVASAGRLHAAWWEHPRLDQLEWMPYINDPVHLAAEAYYQQSWPAFLERWGASIPPEMRVIGEKFATRVAQMLHDMAARPRTIVHGDYRLDNLFFASPDGGDPLTVIDWQITNRGMAAFDISYFMAGNLTIEMRRAQEQDLLHLYHDTLVSGGVRGYTFDDLMLDYRAGVMFSYVYNVNGSGNVDLANERGLAMWRAWLDRSTIAIADLDAGATLPA